MRVNFGLLMVSFFLFAVSAAPQTQLNVTSPSTVSQGSTFEVDVMTLNAVDLFDYQFDLTFNPGVLSAVGVSEGPFLSNGGTTFFLPGTIDNSGGTITLNADSLLGPIPGVSGSGVLVQFDFTALEPGLSNFAIQNVLLQDSTGAILDSTTNGGSVTVTGTSVTPEPSSFSLMALGIMISALASSFAKILAAHASRNI